MCVAYSVPKNLGNIFTYRKVDRLDGPSLLLYGVDIGGLFFFIINERKREREGKRER